MRKIFNNFSNRFDFSGPHGMGKKQISPEKMNLAQLFRAGLNGSDVQDILTKNPQKLDPALWDAQTKAQIIPFGANESFLLTHQKVGVLQRIAPSVFGKIDFRLRYVALMTDPITCVVMRDPLYNHNKITRVGMIQSPDPVKHVELIQQVYQGRGNLLFRTFPGCNDRFSASLAQKLTNVKIWPPLAIKAVSPWDSLRLFFDPASGILAYMVFADTTQPPWMPLFDQRLFFDPMTETLAYNPKALDLQLNRPVDTSQYENRSYLIVIHL